MFTPCKALEKGDQEGLEGRRGASRKRGSVFLVSRILGGACKSFIFDAMIDHVKHLIRAPSVFTTPGPQKKKTIELFVGEFHTNKTFSVVSCHVHVDC